MKRTILSLLLVCFLITGYAQEDIRVTIKQKDFAVGNAPAFVVEIPQADFKSIEKAWEKLLKSETKAKVETQDGEIFILNKVYDKISADSIDIFGYVREYDNVCLLSACFRLNGRFISEDSDEELFYPAKKYIRDFAVEQYQIAVKNELNGEQKILKKLNAELARLESAKEGLIKEINAWERSILQKRDAITLNEMDQSDKVLQIQAQKEMILKLANAVGDEQDAAEKTLKSMEKDFKKLQKEHDNFHTQIDNLEASIRGHEKSIESNEKAQKLLKLDIEDQEYKTRKIQNKLDGIK